MAPNSKKSANCLSHAIAGTATAIATPRKQIWSDERLRPARKAPSASSIKSTRPVAGAGNELLNAGQQHDVHCDQNCPPLERLLQNQLPASVPIAHLCPFRDDADNCHRQSQKFPVSDERLVRNVRVGHARNCQHQYNDKRQLPIQEARIAGSAARRPGCILRRLDLAHRVYFSRASAARAATSSFFFAASIFG